MNATVDNVTPNMRAPAAAPAGPDPDPPLAILEVVSATALSAYDRLPPKIVPLWWDATDPKDLVVDGKCIARLVPTDSGQKVKYDLAPEVLELLTEQHGTPDDGTTDDRFIAEGEAAVRAVLAAAPVPPAPGEVSLRSWRGDRESRLRQSEAVGRAHGLSPEAISRITLRPCVSRKHLLPTCSAVRRLEEQRKAEAEAAAREEAEVEAARVEAARPRNLAERGVEILKIDKLRSTSNLLDESGPYRGARFLGQDGTHVYFGFEVIEGLELPEGFEQHGVRILRRTDFAPAFLGAPPEPSTADALYARTIRSRSGTVRDLGPIDPKRFTDRGLERAHALVDKWHRTLVLPLSSPFAWRASYLVEAAVRGCLVRPDLATEMIVGARNAFYRQVPELQSDWQVDPLGSQAVLFAARGDISAGALLEPEPASPSSHETTKSKKAAR